jgi:hypothetical protein
MIKIEKSLRLPGFQEDTPIVLGNGETFHIRPPRFVYYPKWGAGNEIETCVALNYGQEWEDRISDTFAEEYKDEELFERISWFADRMLTRNYREEIRAYYRYLLYVHPNEPDSKKRMYMLWDIARGFDPKGLSSDMSKRP